MTITDTQIGKETENKLLGRKEIWVTLEYEGATPSREEIKKTVADKMNLKQEGMIIVEVDQQYGSHKTVALIHEYTNKEMLARVPKHLVSRPNKKKEKAAAAPAPKAEAAPKAEEAK